MNILLVGGLNVNPDRFLPIIAAHNVYGIWESAPNWNVSVKAGGPYVEIPTITIADIPKKKIDVVWSLLSPWDGLKTTLVIRKKYPKLPIIRQTQGACTPWWHTVVKTRPKKRQRGNYDFSKLKKVLEYSTGLMFISEKYRQCLIDQGAAIQDIPYIISNGMAYNHDLISNNNTVKLRTADKTPHIALIGRDRHKVNVLLKNKIHVHYHSLSPLQKHAYAHKEVYRGDARMIQNRPIHIKKIFDFKKKLWQKTFSRYDAGLMHFFNPNGLDVFNGTDINVPGRVNTYIMHGLPPIISNKESAIQDFLKDTECAIDFLVYGELIEKLNNDMFIKERQRNTLEIRDKFSMQYEFNNNVLPFMRNFI